MIDRTLFHDQVREALHHLYDYERLRELDLGVWLGAEPGPGGRRTLNRLLIEAVEALKPAALDPPDTPDWRAYSILFYRFVQCMSAQEVANQLGIGERHYRRHQAQAIQRLVDLLWKEQLAEHLSRPTNQQRPGQGEGNQKMMQRELAWLHGEHKIQRADLQQILAGVLKVLAHLAAARGVQLATDTPTDLPRLRIHPQAMRQVLVNILSHAIEAAAGGQVTVAAQLADQVVQLQIVALPANSHPAPAGVNPAALAISHQLLEMAGGRLQLMAVAGGYGFTIKTPVARRLPVVIVEDNPDTAELFARYLIDSRYRSVLAPTGKEALALAAEVKPAAIILDVMMPEQDGWDTLILLRTHPTTEAVPVIVTTILSDRELALSLGAADFLHKPVNREQLLFALDQAVGGAPDPPAV